MSGHVQADVRAVARTAGESQRWLAWFRDAPASARRSLLAAWLGWMLDAFDVMLYALVIGALIREFGLSKTSAGLLGSMTLVASGFGGVLFGLLADRYGRRPALVASVLVYSVFTFACGLSQSIWQLGLCRFLLGFGMGGEWTSGAVLVSETWPDAHRGKALGLMQSAWSIGYALAALAAALILPRFGWRVVFYIGLAPALLALWARRGVDESPVWLASRGAVREARPIRAIFGAEYRRYTLLLLALSLMTLVAYWGLNLWIPAYLSLSEAQGGMGLGTWATSTLVVIIQAGTFFGYVSFGYVADRFGRRRSFVTYLLVAAVMIFVFAGVRDPVALAVFGPITTFFGTGFFSGFAPVAAELYPTAIRATAQGFTFNMGRIGSAVAPFLIGSLAETRGFGLAFALLAVALLVGASTWIWLPETRGAGVR